jgi:hypothetical protein
LFGSFSDSLEYFDLGLYELGRKCSEAAPKKATPKIPKSAVKVCDCGVEGHRSPYPTVVKHVTVKYKASTTVQVGSRTQW